MKVRLGRRRFLQLSAATAAAAALPSSWGCGDDAAGATAEQVFPQGVASGDPKPSSIVLWTRVASAAPEETIDYELALDESFSQVIASGSVGAKLADDHTVRVKIAGLESYQDYYYRFRARDTPSMVGRTKTAPRPDQDVPVRFAVAVCQDLPGRYFHAYRALLEEEAPVDFVLFLGDYIYETTERPPVQVPTAERRVELPDGLALDPTNEKSRAAATLADFRALYRQYRLDPHLQQVHQRYAFVAIWDDHEFANDCWQDHAMLFDGAQGEEEDTPRREAATRAFFEYLPLDVEYEAAAGFPDDIALYRSLSYGKHVELLLTDQRYYRSDHVIPEGPIDAEVGKTQENTALGSRIFVKKDAFDLREAEVGPTMLGADQLSWLLARLPASAATWKLIASPTVMAQMLLDLSDEQDVVSLFRHRFYYKLDQWDGYRSERQQLIDAMAQITNVVALSGDIHAFYAAELRADFDVADSPAVAVEYVAGAISSMSVQEQTQVVVDSQPILSALGLGKIVPRFDQLLLKSNPHWRVSRSDDNGYAIVEARSDELLVDFVIVRGIRDPLYGGVAERLRMRTPTGQKTIEMLG